MKSATLKNGWFFLVFSPGITLRVIVCSDYTMIVLLGGGGGRGGGRGGVLLPNYHTLKMCCTHR